MIEIPHRDAIGALAGPHAQTSTAVYAAACAIAIHSDEEYRLAGQYLQQTIEQKKAAEGILKQFAAPLEKHVKDIKAFFKPSIDAYKATEDVLRRAMAAFKERERQEKHALLEAAEQKQTDPQAFHTAMVAAQVPAAKADGISTRIVWHFEVTDPALVPREYLCIDEKKIGAAVRESKGAVQIPGVRAWSETALTVRT